MRILWNAINDMKINKITKSVIYLGVLILINLLIGFAAWLVLGRLIKPGIDWMLCFMGYPAIFVGFFGGIIYLYNHEFA